MKKYEIFVAGRTSGRVFYASRAATAVQRAVDFYDNHSSLSSSYFTVTVKYLGTVKYDYAIYADVRVDEDTWSKMRIKELDLFPTKKEAEAAVSELKAHNPINMRFIQARKVERIK